MNDVRDGVIGMLEIIKMRWQSKVILQSDTARQAVREPERASRRRLEHIDGLYPGISRLHGSSYRNKTNRDW